MEHEVKLSTETWSQWDKFALLKLEIRLFILWSEKPPARIIWLDLKRQQKWQQGWKRRIHRERFFTWSQNGSRKNYKRDGGATKSNSWEGLVERAGRGWAGKPVKSVITQEVWNSDLWPHSRADTTMVKMWEVRYVSPPSPGGNHSPHDEWDVSIDTNWPIIMTQGR